MDHIAAQQTHEALRKSNGVRSKGWNELVRRRYEGAPFHYGQRMLAKEKAAGIVFYDNTSQAWVVRDTE